MVGTGSYYMLCIEYTLHYNVISLAEPDLTILLLSYQRIVESYKGTVHVVVK
jgi:hypothetical protein